MNQRKKLILSVIITNFITAVVFSYLAAQGTTKTIVKKVREVEVFNDIGKTESWITLEKYLLKGCNKEALEFVKNEKTMAILGIKYQVGNDKALLNMVKERNSNIAKLMKSSANSNRYTIPTCK